MKTRAYWPAIKYRLVGDNMESKLFQSAEEVPDGWVSSPKEAREHPIPVARKPGRPRKVKE